MATAVEVQASADLQITVESNELERKVAEASSEETTSEMTDLSGDTVTSPDRTKYQSAVERLQSVASNSGESITQDGKERTSQSVENALPAINSITGDSEAELLAKLEQANR